MEEDTLGTREETVGDRYTTCSRCGGVFLRRQGTLDENEVIEETHSEQEELCPVCRKQVRAGDDPPPS